MKFVRFVKTVLGYLSRGEFSRALLHVAFATPKSLFRYNQARILRADSIGPSESTDSIVSVKTVGYADIPAITDINGMTHGAVKRWFDNGAECYAAFVEGEGMRAVTWVASGRCYIRGVGFEYDFGPNGKYLFGVYTHPQARGRGLFRVLQSAIYEDGQRQGGTFLHALVEFTNEKSYAVHQKAGYRDFIALIHLRMLFLTISYYRNLETNKRHFKLFLKEPEGRIVII